MIFPGTENEANQPVVPQIVPFALLWGQVQHLLCFDHWGPPPVPMTCQNWRRAALRGCWVAPSAPLVSGVWVGWGLTWKPQSTSASVIKSLPSIQQLVQIRCLTSTGWKQLLANAEPLTIVSQTELSEIFYVDCRSVPQWLSLSSVFCS